MDNPIFLRFKGEDRPLNYSVEVMFDTVEKFGNVAKALDALNRNSPEGFEAVRWFAAKLINDGELCRREEGQDRLPMVKEKDLSARMRPADFEMIRAAVIGAITRGYRREIHPPRKRSGIWAWRSWNQKNRRRGLRAEYNYIAVTVLHLSRRELYRMAPASFWIWCRCIQTGTGAGAHRSRRNKKSRRRTRRRGGMIQ